MTVVDNTSADGSLLGCDPDWASHVRIEGKVAES